MLKHSLNNVTEHTLAYLADSPICLTLNLLFHYDEEMTNMTSSFIHNESSLTSNKEGVNNNNPSRTVRFAVPRPTLIWLKTQVEVDNIDRNRARSICRFFRWQYCLKNLHHRGWEKQTIEQ